MRRAWWVLTLVLLVSCGAADQARRESLYEQFPPFPGAEKISSERYEITSDGRSTGDYGLKVTYRLPDDVLSGEVLDHYRGNIPGGWEEASDATCAAVLGAMPAPPMATALDGTSVSTNQPDPETFALMQRNSQLTVFADVGNEPDHRSTNGITFALLRNDDEKLVVLDAVTYACGGGTDPDQAAAKFDE